MDDKDRRGGAAARRHIAESSPSNPIHPRQRKIQPMTWFQTYTGKRFDFLDWSNGNPIDIKDIAHSLSLQCRFAGHCREFYSVAEHSVRVAEILPPHLQRWGLLHDAAEAYVQDIVRPRKQLLHREFSTIRMWEQGIEKYVWGKFGLEGDMPPEVKWADTVLLMTERRDLLTPTDDKWEFDQCAMEAWPLPEMITPWAPGLAKARFLSKFYELYPDRKP